MSQVPNLPSGRANVERESASSERRAAREHKRPREVSAGQKTDKPPEKESPSRAATWSQTVQAPNTVNTVDTVAGAGR